MTWHLQTISPVTRTELLHDGVTLLLWHVTVHRCHSEVSLHHLLTKPIDLKDNDDKMALSVRFNDNKPAQTVSYHTT